MPTLPGRRSCIPAASDVARGQILPLHPQGNVGSKALGGSRESELLPPRNHNPCLSCQMLQHLQVSDPAQERCCWTAVQPLGDGCCRQRPASDAGLCWKITCHAPPALCRKPISFYFTPNRSLPGQQQVPRAAASLHFANAPRSPPRAAALLNRLCRNKPARAMEQNLH